MPYLHDDIIRLRAVEPEDVDFLLALENDSLEWIQSENYQPFSREVMKKYASGKHDLASHSQYRFVIERISDKKFIGAIDLFDYQPIHSRAGVGVYILTEFRRFGVATRALELLMEYSSQVLNLELLFCSILETNKESVKLFRNAGFDNSGFRKSWAKIQGKRISILLFQKELKFIRTNGEV